MQSSKIIDVTRSFVPIDPNAYPETMHGTDREDAPEKRFPVVPYIGHNFLPTSYGYRSFFGTNAKVNIDSLAPNKPQHIIIFQSQSYKNVLVALCDTGIWAKNGTSTGAWTQLVALGALGNVYYEWTFAVIKNVLYAFRNNGAAYYKIISDGSALGVALTSVVPNFITIAAQLGLFRLGARLAFWDGTNAVAWCNPDDFSDFTPAVLTGANVTTFNSVTGKISAIRTHGKHAIIYATKSITLLEVSAAETFFVKANPLLPKAGVAYLHQSVVASPDSIHFAYTDSGIYKIENGRAEIIVPEVFDYFKQYTSVPVYLNFLQGRYLCFEILDPRLVNGNAQFTTVGLPLDYVTFPVGSLDALVSLSPSAVNICQAVDALTRAPQTYSEQVTDVNTAVPPANRKIGTLAQPIYKCYISDTSGEVPDPIAWTATPCGGTKFAGGTYLPSPSTNVGKVGNWTTTSSGKTAKDGRDVWVDGKWTMQRFVQYQSAIWKRQEKAQAAYVADIVARTEAGENIVTGPINTCVAVGLTETDCTIGRYATTFSGYQFGFNKCSFWLTRYALGATDVINRLSKTTTCDSGYDLGNVEPTYYVRDNADTNQIGPYASPAAAIGTWSTTHFTPAVPGNYVPHDPAALTGLPNNDNGQIETQLGIIWPQSGGSGLLGYVWARYPVSATNVVKYVRTLANPPVIGLRPAAGTAIKIEVSSSANRRVDQAPGVLGVETAYCELIGYKWTNTTGVEQFTPVAACGITADKYPGSGADTGVRQVPSGAGRDDKTDDVTGEFCGIPFEDPDLEVTVPPLVWEDQTVIYPASEFLLQIGSIAPVYPTKYGAFVYDLHLKKWGKIKLEYKQLLDYSAINGSEGSPVNFDVFGILAGAVKADGFIYLFDNDPSDSLLTWGKVGYYRAGMTDLQEVRFDFASVSDGTITIDLSLNGHQVASDMSYSEAFNGISKTVYPPYTGKWYNISLKGKWDVSYIEPKGLTKGRR